MNTLNRDRNTLKRLVESYGKKDVIRFLNNLNEASYSTNKPTTAVVFCVDEKNLPPAIYDKSIKDLVDYNIDETIALACTSRGHKYPGTFEVRISSSDKLGDVLDNNNDPFNVPLHHLTNILESYSTAVVFIDSDWYFNSYTGQEIINEIPNKNVKIVLIGRVGILNIDNDRNFSLFFNR